MTNRRKKMKKSMEVYISQQLKAQNVIIEAKNESQESQNEVQNIDILDVNKGNNSARGSSNKFKQPK